METQANTDIFPILILNGRPAAGKSELIAYLNALQPDARRERFRIGELKEVDDFPMLWTWFEEDDILQRRFNLPRLHSDDQGFFLYPELWHLLIVRLSNDYAKLLRDQPDLHQTHTVLIEFSRGTEHGGYRAAYPHLSDAVLDDGAILYIDVPYEESLRKNRRRFNPEKPDSILEHGLPDWKLERMYRAVDFHELAAGHDDAIPIRDRRVPYAIFDNRDDLTTTLGPAFESRLETTLDTLWQRRAAAKQR
ncbi:MAG: hypothetical protein GX613_14440 [Chloroflexi bacterium]|nr:hypothetical protein [Chloroflexota bacterium]